MLDAIFRRLFHNGEELPRYEAVDFVGSGVSFDEEAKIVTVQLPATVDLSELEDDVDAAEEAIVALDGRLDTAESEINTLKSDLDTAESAIGALDTRLDTAETEINTLQADVDTAEAAIAALEELWFDARVYNVGKASGMYATVQAAVDAINAGTAPSANDRALIMVYPGKYTTTATITLPAFVGISGVAKELVQFQNDTTSIFICSGSNYLHNFRIEGSATAALYAIDGNNSNGVHIRRVEMLNNGGAARQKFFTQVGATWETLFIEDCIVDFYGTSSYPVLLQNSGAAARFVDAEIVNCFFDAYQLTGFGGSFTVRGVQDCRFFKCKIRGAATWNTGIRHELGGVTGIPDIEIAHCFMEGAVDVFGEAGTHYDLIRTWAPGALTSGTRFVDGRKPGMSADRGNAAATLEVTDEATQRWGTALTADRAVTLSTTGAVSGVKFRIVRMATATGAFNLNVGTGPLKALAVGQWCDVEYTGASWQLMGFGSL